MRTKTVKSIWPNLPTALLSQKFALIWASMTALYLYGWATRWTFDPATTSNQIQNSFFTEQARSMLRGHLWINPQAHPWECFFIDQKCYGYFGIVPSLFRMPLVILGGSRIEENAALFIALAAGIAIWAGVDLCRRILHATGAAQSTWAPWSMASAAMLLGPAGLLLLLIDPYVYQESLAWSAAGTLVAANYVFRWWQTRSLHLLVVATIALVVASGARPTSAFAGAIVAVGLWSLTRKENRGDSRTNICLLALALLPIITTFGVMMLKFGSPIPPADSYESRTTRNIQYVMSINPGPSNGAKIIPTTLFAYLRPDALSFESSPPFVNFRFGNPAWGGGYKRITYLPPLPKDYLYVERTTSLVALTPLGVAAVIGALSVTLRKRRQRFHLILLASMAAQPAIMLMTWGVSLRYLADFYPLVAMSIVILIPYAARLESQNPRTRRIAVTFFTLFIVWSLWVIPAMATQDSRIYQFGIAS